jgi:NifU-like protein involved in Fe-S cluster formation
MTDTPNNAQLYQQRIMGYYQSTAHRGAVENPTFISDKTTKSCGDHIVFTGILKDGKIVDIKFTGDGSMLSQAFAAMLCEFALGKPMCQVMALGKVDIPKMLGCELGPTRLKTVVFVLELLQNALCGAQKTGESCSCAL